MNRTQPHADDVSAVVVLTRADLERRWDRTSADDSSSSATLSVEGAARYLGISRSHAYDLVRAGDLPHLRLGRRIVIPRRDLDAFVKGATHHPEPHGDQKP